MWMTGESVWDGEDLGMVRTVGWWRPGVGVTSNNYDGGVPPGFSKKGTPKKYQKYKYSYPIKYLKRYKKSFNMKNHVQMGRVLTF